MNPIIDDAPRSGAGGAEGGALGNIANKVSAHRLIRFQRRQRSSGWLVGDARETLGMLRDRAADDTESWARPLRPARCRWRAAATVGVHVDENHGYAHYSGLERCASIWACPVCSPVIRAGRAAEISRAVKNVPNAYSMAFVTMTQRHKAGDALAFTLDVMLTGWRKLQTRRAWRNLADRYGYVGSIRATEITYGASGWHPHNHLLMFFDRPLTARLIERFQGEIGALWIGICKKMGAGIPTEEHGSVARLVTEDGSVLAEYISKVQEKGEYVERRANIGLEIARGDLKSGKIGSLMPFELLDASGEATETARTLWLEYVHATRGRRAFSWSRGLRELLLPDEEELTDEEIIEETEQKPVVAHIPGKPYDKQLRDSPEMLAEVLELAEAGLSNLIASALDLDIQSFD